MISTPKSFRPILFGAIPLKVLQLHSYLTPLDTANPSRRRLIVKRIEMLTQKHERGNEIILFLKDFTCQALLQICSKTSSP